uniref:Uncharacterized protein C9G1.06c n=1 Tax=Anthurium amnicola TaxID=1678845 RepID=A0A1D1ZJ39_9ARAE
MASLSPSSPGKPLRLKDFLMEDTNSDSCSGFRTVPRRLPDKSVRYLLAMELSGDGACGDRPLPRCPSKGGALTKITAVINAVKMLPFASTSTAYSHDCNKQGGFLSRSFSRKLRRGFWRKREKEHPHRVEDVAVRTTAVMVRDIVRLRSLGDEKREAEATEKAGPRSPPSPVSSNKSSRTSSAGGGQAWSDTESAGLELSSSCGSSVCDGELKGRSPDRVAGRCASPCSSPCMALVRGVGEDSVSKATCHRELEVKEEETAGGEGLGCPCHYEKEKDQLSPVSVMDFPYEEEDNDEGEDEDEEAEAERASPVEVAAASPPSFHHSLAKLERAKQQLLQKIRDFESLAALVDPVDLDARFASSDDEGEPDGHNQELHDHEDDDEAGADDQLLQFQVEIQERAFSLFRELQRRGGSPGKASAGGLLVDFFAERLSYAEVGLRTRMAWKQRPSGRTAGELEEELLLQTAEDWVAGRRRGEDVHSRVIGVSEVEMDGRWTCPHVDEEGEIAGDLEAVVVASLVDELLVGLFQN